ncbi:DUF423 domain-containing protein [Bordetella pseudohinzii]|uniref:Protein of uncharacterized function (DUF423) n=1 Tax=Bordetella pseudohinzii TaxID=1331258 RepID=A0A0J6C391_9BORD|nr:DUF423 domain-containing protein [Bordetella pseudohinzii]ANY16267.1 hypothetical protein BBN53_10390 [Bordetella pseudohinzii]KMM25231.1 membrane protein [Bordetella pseudohinzii]KXA75956.1 hypothetical protein AW877_18280 [Bordetella pseudohinzii]KXA77997.1 hypothetical protein AW878_14005 [Bordetella pseudohinzii]CUJ14625.1 Protein of uncharacterised function (DUF423) [Bordetella pseudohinzii]
MPDRPFIVLAALNMIIAVGAGAFGAHGLKRVLDPDMLAVWQTGVLYHLIHALGLLAVAWLATRYTSGLLPVAGWLMFAGIVLFSGSLYLLAGTGTRILGAITPLGGVAFLLSWALIAWTVWRHPL